MRITVPKLGLVPWLVECAVVAIMTHYLLDLPWICAFLLGYAVWILIINLLVFLITSVWLHFLIWISFFLWSFGKKSDNILREERGHYLVLNKTCKLFKLAVFTCLGERHLKMIQVLLHVMLFRWKSSSQHFEVCGAFTSSCRQSKKPPTLLHSLKISGTTHRGTQRHIAEDLLSQQHCLGKIILQYKMIFLSVVPPRHNTSHTLVHNSKDVYRIFWSLCFSIHWLSLDNT